MVRGKCQQTKQTTCGTRGLALDTRPRRDPAYEATRDENEAPGDWEAARWPFVIGPWRIPTRRLLIVQWHEHGASRPPIVNNCTPLCLPPFFFWGEERGVCCISFNLAPTADRRKAWLLLPPSLVLYSKQTLTLQAICYKLLRYKKRKNSIQVIITNLLQNYCITSLLLH